jgi:hypothetical protein
MLKICLSPILFTYSVYRAAKNKQLNSYFNQLAVIIDVFGNVLGQHLFNRILKKPGGYLFGNRRDTISYAMGINKKFDNLSKFGKRIEKILNWFDEDHLNKTINNTKQ